MKLLDENVEALREAWIEGEVTLNDRFIDTRTTLNVVRFDRQKLLQRVGCAVGLDGPDFHLSETLTTELRLTAERLLGHQAVRPDGTCVDLIVNKVIEFEHVHHSNRNIFVECLTGASVIEDALAAGIQTGTFKHLLDFSFRCAIEDWCRDVNAGATGLGKFDDVVRIECIDEGKCFRVVVNFLEEFTDVFRIGCFFDHFSNSLSNTTCTPSKMCLKDLADVHAAWNAEWVENEVNWSTVVKEWHVFFRKNPADDTLVSVASGHFIADLQLAFNGHINFDHFDNARRQFVTLAKFFDFFAVVHANNQDLVFNVAEDLHQLEVGVFFGVEV